MSSLDKVTRDIDESLEDEEEEEEYVYEDDGDVFDDDEGQDNDDYVTDNQHISTAKEGDTNLSINMSHSSDAKSSAPTSADKRVGPVSAIDITSVPYDSFHIMESSDIEKIMRRLVTEVSTLLDVSYDVSKCLLQNNKWNKEKLIESFFANSEKVMKNAGVDLYDASVTKQFRGGGTTEKDDAKSPINVNCRICYDQFSCASDVFSLGCKHHFCQCCYSEYLDNQIREGQLCIIARCPEFKCLQTVTESVFQKLADPSLKLLYDRYMLRNFIETYKNMKHCPAPGM